MQEPSARPYEQLLEYLNSLSAEARARVSSEILSALPVEAAPHPRHSQQTLGEYLYEIAVGPKPCDFDPEFERVELGGQGSGFRVIDSD